MNKYTCELCEKKCDKIFAIEDDGVCESCFNDAITRAEYMAESFAEDEAVRKHEELK